MIAGIHPDSEYLSFVLSKVLNENGYYEGKIAVLDRQPNVYTSTYPSEIVSCLLQNGRTIQIFCKYGSEKYIDPRGNIDYESKIYRSILQPLHVSSPVFYGMHNDVEKHETWLFLEYIDRALRLIHTETEPVIQAAGWIGKFHAATEAHLLKASQEFLLSYDVEYYLALTRQTLILSGQFHCRPAWLSTLCRRVNEVASLLLPEKQTVIHGEYYPKNILYQDGIVRPIDWQTAAIAAGEIDLATLTENWPPEVVLDCEREYQRTRWSEYVPENFFRILGAARLCLQFRYLGSQYEWRRVQGNMSWRLERLKDEGEKLGLI